MQRPGGMKELGKFKGQKTIRMIRAEGVRKWRWLMRLQRSAHRSYKAVWVILKTTRSS